MIDILKRLFVTKKKNKYIVEVYTELDYQKACCWYEGKITYFTNTSDKLLDSGSYHAFFVFENNKLIGFKIIDEDDEFYFKVD